MHTFATALLAVLTLLAVSLQRTYAHYPLKELKHRARQGNQLAAAILKAVGYGHSLRAVMWFLIGISSGAFFVMVAASRPFWLALCLSAALIWLGFVWLPAARVTRLSERLAAWAAPVLARFLLYVHPIVDGIIRVIRRHRPISLHTGLYDRSDLVDLLDRQQVAPHNRIERVQLDLARRALTFGDDTVGQHMIPRRAVKSVAADEPLGPIVMDELHASGHSRFPVYDGKKGNVVGTLFLRDLLTATHGGTVRSRMKEEVSYIHEDQSLQDALQAILKTHHQLFIVVNSFEEYVGIITIEDILETIIGHPIIDEFDQYGDIRAVAARAARQEHQNNHGLTLPAEETTSHDRPE
ncbi:MAG TPA: CBS domain-containing protein [Candidatus Limnocylindrales bacterium]|nr:CBS domain-containing protein [Candidatus Limnocylindrales bacterium]